MEIAWLQRFSFPLEIKGLGTWSYTYFPQRCLAAETLHMDSSRILYIMSWGLVLALPDTGAAYFQNESPFVWVFSTVMKGMCATARS